MGSLANYAEDAVLNHVLKRTPLSVPTDLYVGLSLADPLDDGSGIDEPVGGSYARVVVNSWTTAAGREVENTAAVVFPKATGDWGLVTHWFIADASSGGNIIATGAIQDPTSLDVLTGRTARFRAGYLVVRFLAGAFTDYLAHKMLDHIFKTASYSQPANLYAGFSLADPGDDGAALDEPVGNGYARVLANSWANSSGGASSNSAVISAPDPTDAWGILTHGCLFDSLTTGNLLLRMELDDPLDVEEGVYPEYEVGDFDITLT